MKRKLKRLLIGSLLLCIAVFLCMPVLLLLTGSIMSNLELENHLSPIVAGSKELISWQWIADYPTLKHYIKILLYMPAFHVVLKNSFLITGSILFGQLFIAVPGAWAFAAYSFPIRKALFSLYIVLMLMPFQVTMLSNYLVLDKLSILDTHRAIILPAIFSTFPVFLMYRGFRSIPPGLLDAARIDGAGELKLFLKIGLPLGSAGILSAMILGFLEYWSIIEQPLAFLKDKTLWPFSLYLPEIGLEQAGYAFAASIITLIPVTFVFILGQDYLEEGIIASAIKE